jgi:hypothetical protein
VAGVRFAPGRTGKSAKRVTLSEEMDDDEEEEEDAGRMTATIKASGLFLLLLDCGRTISKQCSFPDSRHR